MDSLHLPARHVGSRGSRGALGRRRWAWTLVLIGSSLGAPAWVGCHGDLNGTVAGRIDVIPDASSGGDTIDASADPFADGSADVVNRADAGAAFACPPSQTTCGKICTDTARDPFNCGTCNNACATGEACVNAGCATACPNGETVCSVDGGGYCTDTSRDSLNCGACGKSCAAGRLCSAGVCATSCQPSETLCEPDGGTGAYCTNTRSDNANCGKCANACSAGQVCSSGICKASCQPNETFCGNDGGAPYCANTQADNTNCGACGDTCTPGFACSRGTCVANCPPDQLLCKPRGGGVYCATTASDNANCGSCGHACGQGQACSAGVCAIGCQPNDTFCSPAGGAPYCANTASSNTNCGGCGHTCNAGQVCSQGRCPLTCASPDVQCTQPGTGTPQCVDLANDPNHCNGCGNVCPVSPNAIPTCAASSCASVCVAGYADCNNMASDGCEVQVSGDPQNCGRCGLACLTGYSCTSGMCACGSGMGPGSVDQAQLLSDGDYVVSAQQVVGQSFVVGRSGVLTGIEVGMGSCNGVDSSASVQLTVRSNGSTVGTSRISATTISACSSLTFPLASGTVGPGFFDLTGQCVLVTAGDTLTFQLTIVSSSSATCDSSMRVCTSGLVGSRCMSDQDCEYAPRAGVESGMDAYTGGTSIVNGNAQSGEDLSFKTFVR